MALIICPNCWKRVSDKAEACPGCGYRLIDKSVEEFPAYVCEDCGIELAPDAKICTNCGCPVCERKEQAAEIAPQNSQKASVKTPFGNCSKNGIIVAIVSVALIILAIIIGSSISNSKEEKQSTIYLANLQVAKATMSEGSAEAEDAGNLIIAVWYNTIYEKRDAATDKYTRSKYYSITKNYFNSDFNTSLDALFSDSEFSSQIAAIQSNQETVAGLMNDLQNPPEEYAEAYEVVKEMYDAYLELTNLVITPTGNLQTYSTNFNNADTEFLNRYNELGIYT